MLLVGRENQKGRCSQRTVGAQKGQLTEICSARNPCLEQSQVSLNLPKIYHTYSHEQSLHYEKIRTFHSHITKVFGIFDFFLLYLGFFHLLNRFHFTPSFLGLLVESGKSSLFPAIFGYRDRFLPALGSKMKN